MRVRLRDRLSEECSVGMLAESVLCIHELNQISALAATVNTSNSQSKTACFNSVYQYEEISIPSYVVSLLTPCLISLIVVND